MFIIASKCFLRSLFSVLFAEIWFPVPLNHTHRESRLLPSNKTKMPPTNGHLHSLCRIFDILVDQGPPDPLFWPSECWRRASSLKYTSPFCECIAQRYGTGAPSASVNCKRVENLSHLNGNFCINFKFMLIVKSVWDRMIVYDKKWSSSSASRCIWQLHNCWVGLRLSSGRWKRGEMTSQGLSIEKRKAEMPGLLCLLNCSTHSTSETHGNA